MSTSESVPQQAWAPTTALVPVLRHWWVVLLVAVPLAGGAIVYAERLPAEFTSEAVLAVEPTPATAEATGPALVRLLAPTYVEYLTAPATIRDIAGETALAPDLVAGSIDARVVPETGTLTVSAELGDAEAAADLAGVLADRAVDFAEDDDLLRVRVVAPAIAPVEPSGPPRRMIEGAAIALGLGLGVVVATVVDRARPRIRSWQDVSDITDHAILGRLPRVRRLPANPLLAFSSAGPGAAARVIRARIESSLTTNGVLVVTSSTPREGKTTVAALLAVALARGGFHVLLIDGDVRRPGVRDLLGDEADAGGLLEVLSGRSTLDSEIRPGWAEGVDVLPTSTDDEAGDLLTRRIHAVLRDVRPKYDVVIIDAPPIGTGEAATLAASAEAVLLVVSTGTSTDSVGEALVTLATLRARVAGVIVNRDADSTNTYRDA